MATAKTDRASNANEARAGVSAGPIAVIGGGSIGTAFALVFAAAGKTVRVQEIDAARRGSVLPTIAGRLKDLQHFELTREPIDNILARVIVVAEVEAAVEGAAYVQECAPGKS